MSGNPDLITQYIQLLHDTEVPALFHRWSCISGIGALLGNTVHLDVGIDSLHPNLYTLLIAPPGTKKSTSIKIMKRFMAKAGYNTFAAERTSKEKFLMDLAAGVGETDGSDFLDQNLFGNVEDYASLDADGQRQVFITADEFTNFFGNNILDFVSILGELWDYKGTYSSRVKNSESVLIPNPCISILSGSTPETVHENFPASVIGQGFFSRLIFVYSEPSDKLIPFPTKLTEDATLPFIKGLTQIRAAVTGEMTLTASAKDLLAEIYVKKVTIPDTRFSYYSTRRFSQLQKLCMIHAASEYTTKITDTHVRRANTVLTHTERYMPRALGALGKAKNSDSLYRLISVLENNVRPHTVQELWPMFINDLSNPQDLSNLVSSLIIAGKLQATDKGFMIKRDVHEETNSSLYDWDYLTDEERRI